MRLRKAEWWAPVFMLLVPVLVVVIFGFANVSHDVGADDQVIWMMGDWKDALEDYKDTQGEYPLSLADVIKELNHSGTKHSLRLMDAWGMPFIYVRLHPTHRYELGSRGIDRQYGKKSQDRSKFGEGDDITISNGRL